MQFRSIFFFLCAALCLFFSACPIDAKEELDEIYENRSVAEISLVVKNLGRGETFDQGRILAMLRTKVGTPFSHLAFDFDLKNLSQSYDRVVPRIDIQNGEIAIRIELWQSAVIRSILWKGNDRIKTRVLQKELGVQPHTAFHREIFNRALARVKEFYLKKGYFESAVDYSVIPVPSTNEVDIQISVDEGREGKIGRIRFSGLTEEEESALLSLISTKKYRLFTSWLTGEGTYYEEALEHDEMLIVNFLQNRGYADATVDLELGETEEHRLEIHVRANKGALFRFGAIAVRGNVYLEEEEIRRALSIHGGDPFSPENLQDGIQRVRDLYGKGGYVEVSIRYSLHLSEVEPICDVSIEIEEGRRFYVGLIRVLGNVSTKTEVILRESLLVPGEVFDSRRLKATQVRLEGMGYFSSVNVYAVKPPRDRDFGDHYRDITIEVEEVLTGHVNLFGGMNATNNFFGGITLSEHNFDHRGLFRLWRHGLSSLRGGGEYMDLQAQIGKKQQNYTISWMNPYFMDTDWRFGFAGHYSRDRMESKNYFTKRVGGDIFLNYPMTNYWTFGIKYRLENAIVHIHGVEDVRAERERENSGLVFGWGLSLTFDSTDSHLKPHRGFHSFIEGEVGGVRRHSCDPRFFPFLRMVYLNSYYVPIWRKGTLKFRWDFKYLYPFGRGDAQSVPISERFFLGGEGSVRGYKPNIIGPKFRKPDGTIDRDDPRGGISSALVSVEYRQYLFPRLDAFLFFDGGSIADSLAVRRLFRLRMSYGLGVHFEIANHMPITLGYGFPIDKGDARFKHFFWSLSGRF